MNAKSFSLAVLLLTGVASGALAQEREYGRRGFDRPPQATAPAATAPAPAPAPTQAQPAPRAPEARRAEGWRERYTGQRPAVRDEGRRGDGDRRDWTPRQDGQRTWDRGDRDQRRDDWQNRGDRNERRDNWQDRRGRDEPRDDRRWRDRDGRRWDGDRDHDRRDRPQWERRRYPPIYNSPSRYRWSGWRSPPGFYVRSWRYGEILPRAWYGSEYRLTDWWSYGLPEPPYGYEWVRVGADVVLVDIYTGEIVQVVRLVFW